MRSFDRNETLGAIMKMLILTLGGALVLLHLGLALSAGTVNPLPVHLATAVIGAAIAILSLSLTARPATAPVPVATPAPVATPVAQPARAPGVAVAPPPAPIPPRSEAPRAEAEIVAFLALLQEKGRLVDFLREDVAGATDEQVGTAARVVHAGCRTVLTDYLEITPVRTESEGSKLTLSAGYDRAAHRLLGSVAAHPPYTGTLLHPGWAVRAVKLPRVTGTTAKRPWPVLAPAEIQVTTS